MFVMVLNMSLNEVWNRKKKEQLFSRLETMLSICLFFFTDSRLDMVISVMLIKKHVWSKELNKSENTQWIYFDYDLVLVNTEDRVASFLLVSYCMEWNFKLFFLYFFASPIFFVLSCYNSIRSSFTEIPLSYYRSFWLFLSHG